MQEPRGSLLPEVSELYIKDSTNKNTKESVKDRNIEYPLEKPDKSSFINIQSAGAIINL
jgi:hypothetical protein